ncbi:MAG: hypothetical protein GF335_01045 [Candidatus Moranbacteria bacterium]|nr:hypothetical protein [Candidatus Moranbacteria bacterium]
MKQLKKSLVRECKEAKDSNLEVVLTIRNNNKKNQASGPPQDWGKYQETVREIIKKCRPAVISVEYKETSDLYYKGSAGDYLNQLEAAAKAAHKEGAKVTNGGLEGDLMVLLLYNHYLENGRKDEAEIFIQRAFDKVKMHMFEIPGYKKTLKRLLKTAKDFLDIYSKAPIDYINLHWAIDDDFALEKVVDFLEKRTGLEVISTEMRQPQDSEKAKKLMKKTTKLKMPCVVWFFGIEGPDISMIEDKEGGLKTLSKKFKNFIRFRFLNIPRVRNQKG